MNYVQLRIMKEILNNPQKEYSVRGMARAIGVSPGSASKTLKKIEEEGVVSMHEVGRNYIYNANLESALCRQWKVLFNLEKIQKSNLLDECKKTFRNIMSISLYGSRAKGTNDEKSDYDFVIITATKAIKQLDISRIKLDAEINCFVFSFNEWKKRAKTNKAFYRDVLLYGIELEGEKMVVS